MLSATEGEINLTNWYPQNQILPWLFLVRAAGACVPKGMFSQQELLKCKEIKFFCSFNLISQLLRIWNIWRFNQLSEIDNFPLFRKDTNQYLWARSLIGSRDFLRRILALLAFSDLQDSEDHPPHCQKLTPACPSLPSLRPTEQDADLWFLHQTPLMPCQALVCSRHHSTAPSQSQRTAHKHYPPRQPTSFPQVCRNWVMGKDELCQYTELGTDAAFSCSAESELWGHLNKDCHCIANSIWQLPFLWPKASFLNIFKIIHTSSE